MNFLRISRMTIVIFIEMALNMTLIKIIYLRKKTTVTRHPHLDKNLCRLIRKQLDIPKF